MEFFSRYLEDSDCSETSQEKQEERPR
ncbi:MAG: microviridin/marinostatin family tricyclic proteinase inhibitor [Planctomycetes bacterium]|nr:microviridin/marinostatin family tricyclic proteinase inhibitor [Planctomycetota bacterium]